MMDCILDIGRQCRKQEVRTDVCLIPTVMPEDGRQEAEKR